MAEGAATGSTTLARVARLRLFAQAREAAGTSEANLEGDTVGEVLAVQRELTRVQGEIESLQAQITLLESQASMASFVRKPEHRARTFTDPWSPIRSASLLAARRSRMGGTHCGTGGSLAPPPPPSSSGPARHRPTRHHQ